MEHCAINHMTQYQTASAAFLHPLHPPAPTSPHPVTPSHSNVQLTQEANEQIADYYTELRATSGDRALPVTVRSLETIVRLASAHAKVCTATIGGGATWG